MHTRRGGNKRSSLPPAPAAGQSAISEGARLVFEKQDFEKTPHGFDADMLACSACEDTCEITHASVEGRGARLRLGACWRCASWGIACSRNGNLFKILERTLELLSGDDDLAVNATPAKTANTADTSRMPPAPASRPRPPSSREPRNTAPANANPNTASASRITPRIIRPRAHADEPTRTETPKRPLATPNRLFTTPNPLPTAPSAVHATPEQLDEEVRAIDNKLSELLKTPAYAMETKAVRAASAHVTTLLQNIERLHKQQAQAQEELAVAQNKADELASQLEAERVRLREAEVGLKKRRHSDVFVQRNELKRQRHERQLATVEARHRRLEMDRRWLEMARENAGAGSESESDEDDSMAVSEDLHTGTGRDGHDENPEPSGAAAAEPSGAAGVAGPSGAVAWPA